MGKEKEHDMEVRGTGEIRIIERYTDVKPAHPASRL